MSWQSEIHKSRRKQINQKFVELAFQLASSQTADNLPILFSVHYLFNSNNNKLQMGCYPVAVIILHVYKTWNLLLVNLSREGYIRSM